MLKHIKQFGKLPSLAAFYYRVWQRGLGIIFHYKPDSGEYFPQCLSQKFTILTPSSTFSGTKSPRGLSQKFAKFVTEFVPVKVLQYAKTTLKYHTGYKTN